MAGKSGTDDDEKSEVTSGTHLRCVAGLQGPQWARSRIGRGDECAGWADPVPAFARIVLRNRFCPAPPLAFTMKNASLAYLLTAAVLLPLDFLWLRTVGQGFYRDRLGDLLAAQPNLPAAAAFYLVYIAGVVFFVVLPALENGSWPAALLRGALFGLVAYATYDLTNLATLRGWSLPVTLVDIAWGALVTALSAAVATGALLRA